MGQYRIVVIGGNNVDITATANTTLVYGDSNPGSIRTGLGGVGRNIAENLTRLGQHVSLLTVLGDDEFGAMATAQAASIGMDMSQTIRVTGAPSSIYVCINEPGGEMSVAVNDMALCSRITPEYLQQNLALLQEADAIVLDANIPEESIDYVVQHVTVPVFADAVAAKKAARLHKSLPHLTGLKANQIEMELLTGLTIANEHDMRAAAHLLHQHGVEHVMITLGSRGAFYSAGGQQAFAPPLPRRILNTTGCGDAFTAAMTLAVLEGRSVPDALAMGIAAASICAQSPLAVSEQMSYALLGEYLQAVNETGGKKS